MGERLALAVAIAGLLAKGAAGMHVDDVGKLDWHRQNLGRFTSAMFDGRGALTVVGEASTLATVDSRTGELTWRQVLTPEDTILAASAPSTGATPTTVTLSSRGKIVRQWSSEDGSLLWEAALGLGAGRSEGGATSVAAGSKSRENPSAYSAGGFAGASAISTDQGFVVVIRATGIHVLSGASGAVLAQWWCDPAREPELAALVGASAQVTFTSLRLIPGGGGTLLACGWSSRKDAGGDMEAFVVAEISPSEQLIKFKIAQVGPSGVDPSSGIVLARSHGGSSSDGEGNLVAVGLCKGGKSLAVFTISSKSPAKAVEMPLPSGVLGGTASVSRLSDLRGTDGAVLELRQGDGGTVAIAVSSNGRGETGHVSVAESAGGAKEACSCPAPGSECALAGGVSPSGKTFVASASMTQGGPPEEAGGDTTGKLTVNVAELSSSGDFMVASGASFETDRLASLGREATGLIQDAFLEAAEGDACALAESKACFRVLAVNEDNSAVMVGRGGLEWVREEALAAVDEVVFVDSSKDELSILAATGQKVEHDVPGWRERLNLQRLEMVMYVAGAVRRFIGVSLPGSELLDEADAEHSAFGLKKYAVCTTKVGKMYALDMADGAIAWSLFRPSWLPTDAKVLLYATRPKGALGYNPEVVVIAGGKQSTVVSSRDALTGKEISREELDFALASALPLGEKDSKGRAMIMLVDSNKRVHSVPTSAEASAVLGSLMPHLYYHNLSQTGLESFSVVAAGAGDEGAGLASAPVAAVPFHPSRSKMVAVAYADMRDGVPTPAHTLGDDSLLIKYINPRLFAFATLSKQAKREAGLEKADEDVGPLKDRGQELTVTLVDYVSGRILHRITHEGASEPVHMLVSESWVVYTYWSVASQRTEMSTLSLYEGMIDKYGLNPFNRPEWKKDFTSFESRAPIVLQQTFVFPYTVTALGVTLSQQGITAKNILVGTKLGQVVSVDRRFLDPRRPLEEPTKEQKEEKLIQYTPYLPVVPTQVLSYYKVIERVDRVLTEPTGLESTSLVLALGLDLFGTRVAPSKTYDMLDPDFNYALLLLVLGAMAAAVLVAGRLASNKRLKDQWA